MLLNFFLLFCLCESTAATTTWSTEITPPFSPTTAVTKVQEAPLQLLATPDHPVAAGQRVILHCSGVTKPDAVCWQRLVKETWQGVGFSCSDLTLTEPEQSGPYRCHAGTQISENHTVFIVSMHATVGEDLGIAGFALSFLALIIIFALLVCLGWQRLTTSSTAAKGFPAPEKSPKGGLPQTESDGEMYMNYTNTSQAYTDLDPTSVKEDNVYSSLS